MKENQYFFIKIMKFNLFNDKKKLLFIIYHLIYCIENTF